MHFSCLVSPDNPYVPQTSFALHGTNICIPSRGLGTFQVNPKQYPSGSVKDSVLKALECGYRHFDAALGYGWGSVEKAIGEAIREGGIDRKDLFIVTKLHDCFHAPNDVETGIDMSLANLGLEYGTHYPSSITGGTGQNYALDLYLMHFPYAYAKTANFVTQRGEDGKASDKTWAAMEHIVDERKVRSIGVSKFSSPKLARLLKTARIHPVVNKVELDPYFPQKHLFNFCARHHIHITAYGPLGCTSVPYFVGRKDIGPLEDPEICRIAKRLSRIPAQVILCSIIIRGASVIPKSNSLERIAANYHCIFEMTQHDFDIIDTLVGMYGEKGVRNLETNSYLGFNNFNEEEEEPQVGTHDMLERHDRVLVSHASRKSFMQTT